MSKQKVGPASKLFQDLTGKKFGRLTVVEYAGCRITKAGYRLYRWKCKCDCGTMMETFKSNLRSGHTKSCGCFRVEHSIRKSTTHGFILSKDSTMRAFHNVWVQMRQRCQNPNNARYYTHGARGIRVCERWESFVAFRDDMWANYQRNLQIERRDNDGNYEPTNCYWATRKQQANNRRSNIVIELYGTKRNLKEWCEILGLRYGSINQRLKRGWTPERALA